MGPPKASDAEPRPLSGAIQFEEGDFHAISGSCARDPQFDDRRLQTRRKLGALGKSAAEGFKAAGVELLSRTSLHRPTVFNQKSVKRQWVYLCRAKGEKQRLRKVLGRELAGDLDAAYRNMFLCLAIEAERLEVSLQIRSDAWYDGQNLIRRIKADGVQSWLAILNQLDGFRLRLHDWKGEWMCGSLTADRLEEFLGYYKPGEHSLSVEQHLPAPAAARSMALEPGVPESMLKELSRLLPLYRYGAWSKESDFLFGDS